MYEFNEKGKYYYLLRDDSAMHTIKDDPNDYVLRQKYTIHNIISICDDSGLKPILYPLLSVWYVRLLLRDRYIKYLDYDCINLVRDILKKTSFRSLLLYSSVVNMIYVYIAKLKFFRLYR